MPNASRSSIVAVVGFLLAACGSGGTVETPPGPVDAVRSTLVAAPSSAVANGSATVTLTATARDAGGMALRDRVAVFTVGGSGNLLSAATATTSAAGMASVTLASTRAEDKAGRRRPWRSSRGARPSTPGMAPASPPRRCSAWTSAATPGPARAPPAAPSAPSSMARRVRPEPGDRPNAWGLREGGCAVRHPPVTRGGFHRGGIAGAPHEGSPPCPGRGHGGRHLVRRRANPGRGNLPGRTVAGTPAWPTPHLGL